MKINSKEYIDENSDVVARNLKNRKGLEQNPRWKIIVPFTIGCKTILSVGGAAVEPLIINATHVIDITPVTLHYLNLRKWKGHFRVASCTNIPAPNKYFDVAICSEVIEHLPELQDVVDTFEEVDRVSKKWMITTPTSLLGEPTHKRFFTKEDLIKLSSKYNAEVFTEGIYHFVKKE